MFTGLFVNATSLSIIEMKLEPIRTVGSLEPQNAITVLTTDSIATCCSLMVKNNTDCLLALNNHGALCGILSDKDIVYKVIADGLDLDTVKRSFIIDISIRNYDC